jgi:hypothetical protein
MQNEKKIRCTDYLKTVPLNLALENLINGTMTSGYSADTQSEHTDFPSMKETKDNCLLECCAM